MADRQYENATVFNARIVDMRHLWEPSREYKGQPSQKPNWFSSFIVPKTQPMWFNEPALAGLAAACAKFNGIMQMFNYNQNSVKWPVVDGDMPNPETGEVSESAKGHWRFSGSTSSGPPTTELVQAGGTLVKLQNRTGVKPGDYCMTGVTAAVSKQAANAIKLYLNAVVFSAPGEEIVFANSVSGAELMRMAQAQGLQVAGFTGSPGFGQQGGGFPGAGGGQSFGAPQGNPGGFAAPQGGFAPQGPTPGGFVGGVAPGAQPHFGGGQPQVYGAPGFTPGAPQNPQPGFAPTTGNPAFGGAPAQGGMPNGAPGNVTFPSNGTPNFAPGFGQR